MRIIYTCRSTTQHWAFHFALSYSYIMFASLLLALFTSQAYAHVAKLEARTLSNTPQTSGYSTFDLLDIPGPSRSYTTLSTVPSICAQYTGSGQECETTMQAFDVTLGDCGSTWTLCRCTNADIGLEEAMDHLARVPIGLRRNVWDGDDHAGYYCPCVHVGRRYSLLRSVFAADLDTRGTF